MPEHTGTLEAQGQLKEADGVLELLLTEPGKTVKAAGSNNEYLGHVMAGDPEGPGARDRVETLLAELRSGLVVR